MQTQTQQLIAGRYLLQRLVRAHGPVEIWLAHDGQLDRPVLVQRLARNAASDTGLTRPFLRHQQLAASIHNCSSLAAVYDAGTWEGRPFSIMEREKGSPASALYRPGYPPDVPAALKITRQVAEALQCCRDEGLVDWRFAPEAVTVDAEGNGCLAIIEGLEGPYSSNAMNQDSAALGGLLRLMLVGNPNPGVNGAVSALVPKAVADLLERMAPGRPNSLSTAGEAGMALAAIEQASYQPTQAYEPPMALPQPWDSNKDNNPDIFLPGSAAQPSAEAPTLAAQAAPAALASATRPLGPYSAPQIKPNRTSKRAKWVPLAAAIGALLLVAILLVASVPRLRTQSASTSSTPVGQVAKWALAPDVQGKSLDDARNAVGSAGLNLSLADPLHSSKVPFDMVAQQDPPPGAQLLAGSLITVSLSLGPEAQPATPPQKVAPTPHPPAPQVAPPATFTQAPSVQPPTIKKAPPPPPGNKKKEDDKKKGKGKDK